MSAPDPLPGARLLFSLDPTVSHLNHGSFGAPPLTTQRAQQRLREEMEGNPDRFITRGLHDRLAHTRRHLAGFVRADPERTALVANTTTGVTTVLRSIGFRTDDEVLLTDHGYGAVALAVDRFCGAAGGRSTTVELSLTASDDEIVAALVAAVRPGRTRLVIIDLITSPTARRFPVERVVAALRPTGVPVLVDAAHAPGAVPLDVSAVDADFLVGNLHKWAFAPRGTALLTVAERWRARIEPPVVSWSVAAGFPAAIEFQGSIDYTGWLAAPAGLFALRSLGARRVQEHNDALAGYGQRVLGAALGLDPDRLPRPGAPLPMRVVPLPGRTGGPDDAAALRERISDELRTEVAVNAWRGQLLLRLSAQVYNTAEEYQRLAAALPGLLAGSR